MLVYVFKREKNCIIKGKKKKKQRNYVISLVFNVRNGMNKMTIQKAQSYLECKIFFIKRNPKFKWLKWKQKYNFILNILKTDI